MVRKGGPYRKRTIGPTYLNKDNTKLKVIMYLYSVGKANKNRMITDGNSGLKNQEWTTFDNVLDKMVEDELIKKYPSEDAKNVLMYSLLEKGKIIAQFIEESSKRDILHPFFSLDAFYDIKYIGKADS